MTTDPQDLIHPTRRSLVLRKDQAAEIDTIRWDRKLRTEAPLLREIVDLGLAALREKTRTEI